MPEQEPLQPTYHKRTYFSVSTLVSFARCPRRYFYQKCGLQSREEALALDYGTAMHKAIPAILTGRGLEVAMEEFQSVWQGREGDEKRNSKRAIQQLGHFLFTHKDGKSLYNLLPAPEGTLELNEDTSTFEVPALLDVGLPIPVFVRIDGLTTHRDNGDFYGLEFKTTSRLDAKFFDSFEMNVQILTYALALRTLTGKQIKGFFVEGMLIDKSKLDNITHPVLTLDHHLKAIHRWLQYWGSLLLAAEDMYLKNSNPDDASAFVQNFAGCTAYPHFYISSFPCEYMNLCRVENWKDLTSLYDVVPDHNPIKLTIGET